MSIKVQTDTGTLLILFQMYDEDGRFVLTWEKLTINGMSPSRKHPTNIATEIKITATAPSIAFSSSLSLLYFSALTFNYSQVSYSSHTHTHVPNVD